jgi:membrane fusion protein, multidrug efflux system
MPSANTIERSRAAGAPRPTRRRALPLLSLLPLLLFGCARAEAEPNAAPPPTAVSVAPVIAKQLRDFHEFTGRLEASASVDIRPRVSGYIDSVHFAEGARVAKGQLLFRIDPRPFEAEVKRLSAELARARAELELANLNDARATRLLKERVIAEQEADRLRSGASSARGSLTAASAALEAAQLDLEFTRVRSPIAGRVSRAMIQPGNLVSSASLLTTVVADDPIYAYFDADEQSFLDFSRQHTRGEDGRLASSPVFMGLIDDDGFPHEGKLDFVDNRVDARAGTIRVRAVFGNGDGRFTPGLFARLKLVGQRSKPTLLISERAVGTDLGKKFVLAVKPDQTLDYREVTLGASVENLRVVNAGLNADDVIVVNGLSHVRAGMKVAPSMVAMTPNGGLNQVAVVTPGDTSTAATPTEINGAQP